MRYVLIAALLAAVAPFASAAPTEIRWELALETCDGTAITRDEIRQLEIYVSAGPIPAQDVRCPAPGSPVDEPPTSFSSRVEATSADDSVTVDLISGHTYHVRMRARTDDGWSNLSNEVTKEVPLGPLTAPVIISIQ